MPDRREQQAEAFAFLRALFGDAPPKRPDGLETKIALWTKADKRSHYYAASKPAADTLAGRPDVYVSVSLAPKNLGAKRRVKSAESAGIPGLWADVDVVGGPERKTGAAPDLDAALELVNAVLEPTVTLTSGYGLQAWWLLDDGPWIFGGAEEREQAARLAAGWISLLDAEARTRGFGIDHTQDLARLMRLPGTVNAKGGGEAPVAGHPAPIAEQDGPRYAFEALATLARERAPKNGASLLLVQSQLDSNEAGFDPSASPPADKLVALLENSEMFARTWKHTRREGTSWSMSEWDLSLASQAVAAEWADEEVLGLLAMHRREHGGEKLDRPDYFARTLSKAKRQARTDEAERRREDALEDLADAADDPQPDPDATIAAFNRVVGGPPVKEFVQDGRDPSTARFALVMANGDHVPLGNAAAVMSQDRFRAAFFTVTGHVLPKVKQKDWDAAVQALGKVRQVRESEDDTPEGTVADWLSRYLYERLAPHPGEDAKDAACEAKEPFEEDGLVHVFAASFGAFVRQALRVNLPDAEVKVMLRAAGFERRTVHYQRRDGQPSTRSYYAGQREAIE